MKHRFRFHGTRKDTAWSLPDEEWHHLIKVLRLAEGEEIEVCDGQGWVASALVESLGKHAGELSVLSETYAEPRPANRRLTLALGVLKPQTMDELLPMLVELGVDELVLLPFKGMERSRLQEKLFERWDRIIVSAGKQCKAPWFLRLSIAKGFDDFLSGLDAGEGRFLMDPFGARGFADLPATLDRACMVAIGAEQGFAEEERQALIDRGFEPVRFESHILRAITASVAAASLFRPKLP